MRALHAIHHLNGAMMTELHALGEFANRGFPAGWKSAHRQQKKILLRLKTRGPRRLLAAVQKVPDLIPEFRQHAKFGCTHRFVHAKDFYNIRLRYKCQSPSLPFGYKKPVTRASSEISFAIS